MTEKATHGGDAKSQPPKQLLNSTEVRALDPDTFPHPPRQGDRVPGTIENMRFLIRSYEIDVFYDVIGKQLRIRSDRWSTTSLSNEDQTAMAYIVSLAVLNRYPRELVEPYVAAISDERPYNPVKDWILSEPWDSEDRLPAICQTIVEAEGYLPELKEVLIRKWLLSAVAAALLSKGFRSRGVLTLQGAQGTGKTTWVGALVPERLRASFIELDHHLDAHNKDSILSATAHWICEIGELEGSLRKEVARLKGVVTRDSDKVRKPYARTETEMPRRTVFAATVNDAKFLMDDTGNSRWWTIAVASVDPDHGIDMQQLFAQLAASLDGGAQWWLNTEEEAFLEQQNRAHRMITMVEDIVLQALDLNRTDGEILAWTPRELLVLVGIDHPTNTQCKECAGVLRNYVGEPKRIQGRDKWRVPLSWDLQPKESPGSVKGSARDFD